MKKAQFLDWNKNKIRFINLILILFIMQSCAQKKQGEVITLKDSKSTETVQESDSTTISTVKELDNIANDTTQNTKPPKSECFYKNIIKGKTIHIVKPNVDNSKNLKIRVIDDKTNTIYQEISYEPYSFGFECKSVVFTDNIPIHNDYEIIVGDFNFDTLQDFAILYDNTINTGTIFSFFFQNTQGMFEEDPSFPVDLIPVKIDPIKKTLEQVNIIGCCKINKTVYQLKKNKKWEIISSKQENMEN